MIRRIALLASAVIIALALIAPASQAAHDERGTTCANYRGMITISPGLTFTAQRQRLTDHGEFSSCIGGGVTSATILTHARGFTSCTPQAGAQIDGLAVARWNTRKTSVIRLTFTATSNPAVVEVTGEVIGGLFKGRHLTTLDMLSIANAGANCTTVSITAATLHNVEPVTIG
jgi:hypothetical protein